MSWGANCSIDSDGLARANTFCSDGSFRVGPWIGTGYWRFGGDCSPYRVTGYPVEFARY